MKSKPIIGERAKNTSDDFSTKTITVLDSNIPYFIFVDTATSCQTEESAAFRNELDFFLSRNISENGQEIPIVILVLGGTVGTLNVISRSIVNHQMPCIFVESCRKCSEVFSYFVKNSYTSHITDELILDKINEFMSTNTDQEKRQMQKQISQLLQPERMNCISILSEQDRLDTIIISALSKIGNKKGFHDLSLALTWNRIDLANNNLGNLTHINLVIAKFIFRNRKENSKPKFNFNI